MRSTVNLTCLVAGENRLEDRIDVDKKGWVVGWEASLTELFCRSEDFFSSALEGVALPFSVCIEAPLELALSPAIDNDLAE